MALYPNDQALADHPVFMMQLADGLVVPLPVAALRDEIGPGTFDAAVVRLCRAALLRALETQPEPEPEPEPAPAQVADRPPVSG